VENSKIDHDTGKDIKEDICDMITQWIEFPEVVINGITQNPNGLIGDSLPQGKYRTYIFPAQTSDLSISINHRVIPIREEVVERVDIQASRYQTQKAQRYELGTIPKGIP
jgi:hypothetical protein